MRYQIVANRAQRLTLIAPLTFSLLLGGCSGKENDTVASGPGAPSVPTTTPPPTTPPPSPTITSSASYYLAAPNIAADGHGRISLDKLGSGAVRISARINQTNSASDYRLTLQEVGNASATLALAIDSASGYGEQTFTTTADGTPLVFETLLRRASVATVTDTTGRAKMRGSVGANATELLTDLSIDGIQAYIARHEVREVKDILSALPPAMRSNYTFVAQSSGLQASSEAEPRIVLYGADGRFLLSVQTAPGPKRETLEAGELQADGRWRFREIHVATNTVSGESCVVCHGVDTRPIWAQYNQWPGVFGADGDRLTSGEADAITRIKANQAGSDRFHILPLHNARAGDLFSLPHRAYPYTNFNVTTEVVRAVAEGVWTRIRTAPRYKDLRTGFFLNSCPASVRASTNPYWARFKSALDAAGERTASDDQAILRALGINDPVAALQISKKVLDLTPNDGLGYNQAATSLLSFVHFLALDDWIKDQPELGERLARVPDLGAGYVGNVHTGHGLGQGTLEAARRYRMLHNFGLNAEELQRSRERHTAPNYSDGVWRIQQGVFDPARGTICGFLEGR